MPPMQLPAHLQNRENRHLAERGYGRTWRPDAAAYLNSGQCRLP